MTVTLKFQKWWESLNDKQDKEDGGNDNFRLKPHSGSGLTFMIIVLKSASKFTKRVSAYETPRETRHRGFLAALAAKNPRDSDVYRSAFHSRKPSS